jgi:pimeloyl-ACP methyl ester carboxylesterase
MNLPGFADPVHPDRPERLYLEALGHGALRVTFLPGLGGTTRYWISTDVPPLFQRARTELVDLYGFGRSPRPWCRYTVERHVEALARTLEPGLPRVLVGHSLGAALALTFAARYPDRVQALCLLSLPDYGSPAGAVEWFARQRGGWIYTNMLATALACVVTRRVAGRWLPRLVRDVPADVARDLVLHNMASSTTSLWNVLYRHDLRVEAAALPTDLPVTCVHGTRDITAPPARVEDLVSRFPQWHHIVLDTDHHPWLRAPTVCHAEIAALCAAVHHPHGHAEVYEP